MTILEAIQSAVEYENTNSIEKILIDLGLTGSTEYVPATHKDSVDEATAYVLILAARSPDFTEASRHIKFDAKMMLKQARSIFIRLGVDPDTVIGLSGSQPTVKSGGYM